MTSTISVPHAYAPRGACAELFARRDDEVLISGPAGTGKSRACLEKLYVTAVLNPGMRGLIVRKTLVSLGSTALKTWRQHVIPEALETGSVKFYGGSPEEPPQYVFNNGSRVVIGGMDHWSRIMSSEYDMVYVQEATELTPDDWEALTTRLRNWQISYQQILADCNPDIPTHWLKRRCESGSCLMLESRHEDNPTLFTQQGVVTERGRSYIKKLDALTGVRLHRLRRGLWVAAEGVIYDEFDSTVHLVDTIHTDSGWSHYWSVDFGFTNPFVWQCWAEDPDGRLYLHREIYRTRRTVDEHAKEISRLVTGTACARPADVICDHDAEGRAQLERDLGIGTSAANKTVTEGIQAVQRRLRPADDGRPRLFLCHTARAEMDDELSTARLPTSTVEELPGYIWDTRAGKPPKEQPRKENDHGMDATRYMVAAKDLTGSVRLRWM